MTESACSGILVVDDNDDVRDTMLQVFSDEGYRAFGAENGQKALDRLRDGTPFPCVILLDIMMPVMDGRTFRAEQLLDLGLCHIPIVVITAHANIREMETELKTSGALRKPVSLQQLLAVARLHCGEPNGTVWSA